METVLRRTKSDLETLNHPTRKLSGFSSYTPRRSHLDSSSYRSLVRILSHCLNHSLVPLHPPEITLSVKDTTSSRVRGELQIEQEACANINGGTLTEIQEGDCRADGGVQGGVSTTGSELVVLDFNDFDEMEIDTCVNSEMLSRVMSDCARLIDASNVERSGESQEGIGQAGYEEILHNNSKDLAHGAEEGLSHLGKVSEIANGEESVLNSYVEDRRIIAEDASDLLSSEPGIDHETIILVETQSGNSEGVEEKVEVTKQQIDVDSTPLMGNSELIVLEEDQVSTLVHQIDEGEVEEGEIPDEAQNIEDLVDIIDEKRVTENQKKEGPRRNDFNEVASTTVFIHKKEVIERGVSLPDTTEEDSPDEAPQSKIKFMEAREKRRCGPSTEEGKAKKKIAKKRKRAKKNREQGVKKLKLHAVMKPKEVKYCNFYLMGRCQQGDSCKFSHDTTPLTKSMPCKHFACNSCLKGDDCPYDHELSKYPCHNYVSTGNCIRGDSCKFSHKIPTTDASSQLADNKIDSHLTSEQLKLRNKPFGTHASLLDKGPFFGKGGTPPLMHKPLKEVNQVPKGIRFLSFGAVQSSDLSSKVKESAPPNNHQKRDNLSAHGHQSASNMTWNSFPALKCMISSGSGCDASSNGCSVMDSGNIIRGRSLTSGGAVNRDFSEATKILEEFLFCGAS